MFLMLKRLIPLASILLIALPAWAGSSYYTVRMIDPKAVHLETFGAKGDGVTDDSDAIQRVIDRVQETVGQGVLFVPEGRYRMTKTINVWPSIRLIGYGAKRPVFVLAPNTPGYQDKNAERQMIFFAGSRPAAMGARGGQMPMPPAGAGTRGGQTAAPPGAGTRGGLPGGRPDDAGPGTFYSAMTN